MNLSTLNKLSGHAHWLPRISLAATFIYHGLPKFLMTDMAAEMLGLPPFVILLVGLAEVLGGAFILWGGFGPDWATRIAGLLFSGVMAGAIITYHGQYGFNSINLGDNGGRGMEFQILIIAVSLLFVLKGNVLNQKVLIADADG